MVCISWSLSLSLQNTLIGVSFMRHTVRPFKRNNSEFQDNRRRGRFENILVTPRREPRAFSSQL